MLYMYMLYAHM